MALRRTEVLHEDNRITVVIECRQDTHEGGLIGQLALDYRHRVAIVGAFLAIGNTQVAQ